MEFDGKVFRNLQIDSACDKAGESQLSLHLLCNQP